MKSIHPVPVSIPNIVNDPGNTHINSFTDTTLDLSQFFKTQLNYKITKGIVKDKLYGSKKTLTKHVQYALKLDDMPHLDVSSQNPDVKTWLFMMQYTNPFYYTGISQYKIMFSSNTNKKVSLYEPITNGSWRSWEIYKKLPVIKNVPARACFLTNNLSLSTVEPYILYREFNTSMYPKDKYLVINTGSYLTGSSVKQTDTQHTKKMVERYGINYIDMTESFCASRLDLGQKNKYDFICSDIAYYVYMDNLSEQKNAIYQLNLLRFILDKLDDKGCIQIILRDTNTPIMAQIMLIYSSLFKNSYLIRPSNRTVRSPHKYFIGIGFEKSYVTENLLNTLNNACEYVNQAAQKKSNTDCKCGTCIDGATKLVTSLISKPPKEFYELIKHYNTIVENENLFNLMTSISLVDKIRCFPDKTQKEQFVEGLDAYILYNSVEWFNRYDVPVKFKYSKKEMKYELLQDVYNYNTAQKFEYRNTSNSQNNTNKNNELVVNITKNTTKNTNTNTNTLKNIEYYDVLSQYYSDYLVYQRVLDTVDESRWKEVKFQTNLLVDLKKRISNLSGGIQVSQAYLKFYEILTVFDLLPLNNTKINAFYLCEAPGQFIMSTNHYIKTKFPQKTEFNWHAQSLNARHPDNIKKYGTGIFADNYGLIKRYPKRWIWGKDGTGDVTNPENIKFYAQYTKSPESPVEFISSDCGLPKEPDEFAFIEEKMARTNLAQILFILNNLPRGKSFVFKTYLPLKMPLNVSLLFILYTHFRELYAYKPSLNPGSTEFYIVGKGYKPVSQELLDKMFSLLSSTDAELTTKSERELVKVKPEFMLQHMKMIDQFVNNNKVFLIKKLYVYENPDIYANTGIDLEHVKETACKNWIREFEFKKIANGDLL